MRVWSRQSVLEFDLRLGNWTIIVTDPAYFPPNASKPAFQHMPDLSILFLGMNSAFSTPALQALLAGGLKPGALILPPPAGMKVAFRPIHFPISGSETPDFEANLLQLASRHGVPIYEVGSLRDPRALDLVRSAGTDLLITACFPRLLPERWLGAPRLGALNLHPSLLPAYRGPQPLFWQFRLGETDTGVTLHFMDAGADTGDIVSQARVPFPSGISEAQAETLTGQAGADLLLNALADPENIPRRPQPVTGASRQSAPRPQDLEVPGSWEVRRAFNFIRGAQAWGPFEVEHVNGRARVSEAEAFVTRDPAAAPHQLQEEGTAWLEMRGGALQVRLAEASA